jgi:hypothetical protein
MKPWFRHASECTRMSKRVHRSTRFFSFGHAQERRSAHRGACTRRGHGTLKGVSQSSAAPTSQYVHAEQLCFHIFVVSCH